MDGGLIFDLSTPGRVNGAQYFSEQADCSDIPQAFLRETPLKLPEVSELQVVRHYTNLSRKNFSIDTNFYPLGSCSMKYNPRGAHKLAMLPGFLNRHPLSLESHSQGFLACLYELQEILKALTGMTMTSLTPMAGAQGEFAGVAMIKAYHVSRGDTARCEMIVPDAAHGTNPASAAMCGYTVKEVPTDKAGDVDLVALKAMVGPQTAGIMLTNPSTLGVFERKIKDIAKIMHEAGALLYYDGANLNAILGRVRPGDMGFDVVHFNLHKTFATPHGGGGPGSGPVVANDRLKPFIPTPIVIKSETSAQQSHSLKGEEYRWSTKKDFPQSIGRLSAFMGNAGILLRAYSYARLLGSEGLRRVSEFATLNANYLQQKLKAAGYTLAYPSRRASHEFIVTISPLTKQYKVTAMDIAKRLLDYGFYAPTTYFPLLVPECLLIEPTETESKAQLDQFIEALISILDEVKENTDLVTGAPHTMPVHRLDDVKAARELDLVQVG